MSNVSTTSAGMRWGLITGLLGIIMTLLLYVANLYLSNMRSWFVLLVIIVGVILGLRSFKEQNNFMTYGQGLGVGIVIGLFSSILAAGFTYALYIFIDPDLMENSKLWAEEKMFARGLGEDQIEQAMKLSEPYMSEAIFAFGEGLTYIVGAFFCALIASAIMKNK